MANTPTTKELADNIIASFTANFGQKISILPKAFLRVTAKVLGALFIILYKYGGFLGLQMFVRFASASETTINGRTIIPLIELGNQLGVSPPKAAVPAELEIEISVINQGGFLPAGEALLGEKNGVTYLTIGTTSLDAATVTTTILAVGDQTGGNGAGTIGNLDVTDIVNFINPQANVTQQTTVTDTIVPGADGEDLDTEYRQRVLERRQKPPQGGAYADYVIWGTETPGIINIYPYTGPPGEVDVYSEASNTTDGIPTPEQLIEVLDYITADQATGIPDRSPVSSFVNSLPIIRLGFDVIVSGLNVDDPVTVRGEIEKALEQFFLDAEPFISGLSVLPRQDRITESAIAGVIEDVVNAFGGIFTAATFKLGGTPYVIYLLKEGEKAKLKSVVFT